MQPLVQVNCIMGRTTTQGPDKRVKWVGYHLMNIDGANYFVVSNFISGDSWLPVTRIPSDRGSHYFDL